MKNPEFEVHSLVPKETTLVSVKTFAETFGQRDMKKILHRHASEKMELSSDLLLKMLQTPKKEKIQKKGSWEMVFFFVGIVSGVLFAPALSESGRLFGLGILAVGTMLGVFIGMNWKRIEHSFVQAQRDFWDKKFDNMEG